MVLLANSYREIDNLDKALDIFNAILLQYPARPDALLGLAQVQADLGDTASAKASVSKALKGWQRADETEEGKEEAQALLSSLGQ
jgi:TolA-binding protein